MAEDSKVENIDPAGFPEYLKRLCFFKILDCMDHKMKNPFISFSEQVFETAGRAVIMR